MNDLGDGATRAAFLGFLLEAKRATYAGQGDEATVAPLLPGSKQLAPYRGPARFSEDGFTYTNASTGELDAFWGLEQITRSREKVYELRYAGGFLG